MAQTVLETKDVKVRSADACGRVPLQVVTCFPSDQGRSEVIFDAAPTAWNLAQFSDLCIEIINRDSRAWTLHARADSPAVVHDGIHYSTSGAISLEPGQSGTLRLKLNRLEPWIPRSELTGMWGTPRESDGDTRNRLDVSEVIRVVVWVESPDAPCRFEVRQLRAEGVYAAPATQPATPAKPFFPMIDRFGQFMHRDWPGKTRDEADLGREARREAVDLLDHPGWAPWDQYGGWKTGPQLEASGHFRTARHLEKWWLVTPSGHLFFAHGVNAVGEHDYTPTQGREHWFEDLPGNRESFAEFVREAPVPVVRGHYLGKQPMTYSFHMANLYRKYGADWRKTYADLAHRRLRSWGLNAIGAFSTPDIWRDHQRRTPYFVLLQTHRAREIEGSSGWWRKFPDPFDPSFERVLDEQLAQHARQGVTRDPWCIGFFVDNENSWKHDTFLAEAALGSPSDQPCKIELVRQLRARYATIGELNIAWRLDYGSWGALLDSRQTPKDLSGAAGDLRGFYASVADAYFRKSRAAVKKASPGHLYLGCRFPYQVNRLVTDAAKDHCDVISVNWYQDSVEGFEVPGGLDLPLIIGEFHFGALDRGLFHTGLKQVASQNDRAAAYTRYVNEALDHPNIVGVTWFKFSDEPNTGRWLDTENYQIGFLDVCDTPYPETIEAARNIGRRIYGKPADE